MVIGFQTQLKRDTESCDRDIPEENIIFSYSIESCLWHLQWCHQSIETAV